MSDDDFVLPAPHSDGAIPVFGAIFAILAIVLIAACLWAGKQAYDDLRQPTLAPCRVGPSHPCVIPSDAGDLVIYTASYSGGTYWAATPSPRPGETPTPRPGRNP